jgi:hypothetical protein
MLSLECNTSAEEDYVVLPKFDPSISFLPISAVLNDDETTFQELATRWKRETSDFSVLSRRYSHQSYLAILAMGRPAVPLILRALQREPDRWFDALQTLTGENPAEDSATFDEAVRRWIAWGIAHKHIT